MHQKIFHAGNVYEIKYHLSNGTMHVGRYASLLDLLLHEAQPLGMSISCPGSKFSSIVNINPNLLEGYVEDKQNAVIK